MGTYLVDFSTPTIQDSRFTCLFDMVACVHGVCWVFFTELGMFHRTPLSVSFGGEQSCYCPTLMNMTLTIEILPFPF